MLGNIPLTLQIQQYIPAETTEILYTEEQAKELALLNMAQLSRRLEQQGIEIVSSEMAGTVKKGMFVLSADFTCREDVAREVEIIRDSQEEKQ